MAQRRPSPAAAAVAPGRQAQAHALSGRSKIVRSRNPVLLIPDDHNPPRKTILKYHSVLCEFMEYKNSTEYPSEKTFTREELLTITPEDIRRWMSFKMFGKENPNLNSDAILYRSNTLYSWKKSISYFMPNRDPNWTGDDSGDGFGNPTKSDRVNELIRVLNRKEKRQQGKPSQAVRAFSKDEFVQLIDLMGSRGQMIDGLRHTAMLTFQYHMIGNLHDISRVQKVSFKSSTQFPGYLIVKLRRSNNGTEMQENENNNNNHNDGGCQEHIILPAQNPKYCVVLALAFFLEKWIKNGEGAISHWLFCDRMTNASTLPIEPRDNEIATCKKKFSRMMSECINSDSFTRTIPTGNLHTNSVKKAAVAHCNQKSVPKCSVDHRARSKVKSTQTGNIDTNANLHSWQDVQAAMELCDGGVAFYKPRDGSGITDNWLSREVAPGCTSAFGTAVGAVIGGALLWACHEPSVVDRVPSDIRIAAIAAWGRSELSGNFREGANPMEKVAVCPSESQGTVSLDILPNASLAPGYGEVGTGPSVIEIAQNAAQWRAAMFAKISSTQSMLTEMENRQSEMAELKRSIGRLEKSIRQLIAAPPRIVGPNPRARRSSPNPRAVRRATPRAEQRPAILCSRPKTLEVLWDEWENGIGGNKPARLFTIEERRGLKGYGSTFYRRAVFWQCMVRLTEEKGMEVASAFDLIRSVYGHVSITELLRSMKPDERNGGHYHLHPSARISSSHPSARISSSHPRAGKAGSVRREIPGAEQRPAILSSLPKSLEVLWEEWENGIGGNKPARLFTKEERGVEQVKYKFCKRAVFWRCMVRLTEEKGMEVKAAFDLIRSVYGRHVSITELIRSMTPHERNGGHYRLHPSAKTSSSNPRAGKAGSVRRVIPGAKQRQVGSFRRVIPGAEQRPAILSSLPKTLEVLWDEWENGIGRNKPARLFTEEERGVEQVKHEFLNRAFFWRCMVRLTEEKGMEVASAFDLIRSVYGRNVTITELIRSMKLHERNGGHDRLR